MNPILTNSYFSTWVGWLKPPTRKSLGNNKWVFPSMVVPPKHPKRSFLVGKPMVVGYHHFRKPPNQLTELEQRKKSQQPMSMSPCRIPDVNLLASSGNLWIFFREIEWSLESGYRCLVSVRLSSHMENLAHVCLTCFFFLPW